MFRTISVSCLSLALVAALSMGQDVSPSQTKPPAAENAGKNVAPASGNAPGQPNAQGHAPRRRRAVTLDERVQGLAKSLDLSTAQQAALKTILERQRERARRIQTDPAVSGADRINQFRALQKAMAFEIRSILNEEQRKKYDPLLVQYQQKTSPQPSVEDWLKAMNNK